MRVRSRLAECVAKSTGRALSCGLAGLLLVSGSWAGAADAEAQTPASPTSAGRANRPVVGLVLGGGGARGAAHIGVLEVLERLRVKVDCVAGTSMGALVAGAWAAGLSPRQMREELGRADWGDMFLDNPGQEDLSYRSKQLSSRFLSGSETGIRDGKVMALPGVVEGQKIKLFFNRLVRAETGEPELQDLPLPVSMIATDIGTGERVVYRDGSLTQAMRASMSVPGLMAPLEYRARKLVDGGLVDNLPVREVRERCGAQVVIAVNVGSAPAPAESVTGLVSITAQVIVLLSEQNVVASLATLAPTDVYIKPDLGDITAADFGRAAEAADLGRQAGEAATGQLAALSVPEAEYRQWQSTLSAQRKPTPRIDEIKVAGMLRADPAVIRRYIEQGVGEPLDVTKLERDLLRAYGDGHYERVDYSVTRSQQGRHVLNILPVEKSWGPDYLRLGLRFEGSTRQGSDFLLRGGYHKTWLNDRGGELLATVELGSSTGAGVELHQPLTLDHRWFVDAALDHQRERTDYYLRETRLAEYRSARTRLDLVAGINFAQLGQLRVGWRENRVRWTLETGLDVFSDLGEGVDGGWLISLDINRLDRLYFPRKGWASQVSWFRSDRRHYSRAAIDARGAMPLQQWVVGSRLSWVGSPRGRLPLSEAGRLGGFLNLSGFASGQLIGDEVAYAHVRAERIIGQLPAGLRGDMRLGVALEAGRLAQPYAVQRGEGWLHSLVVYLGGETPIGPVYVGVARGSGGANNAYLFVGTP